MSRTLRAGITYKQLGQTLTELGFVRKEADTFTAFADESHDALIVLPQAPPDEQVSDRHLITVERTLEGKGVASPTRFYEVLTGPTADRPRATVPDGQGRPPRRASGSTPRPATRGRCGRKRTKG